MEESSSDTSINAFKDFGFRDGGGAGTETGEERTGIDGFLFGRSGGAACIN
jgi:hypothetical protein